MPRSQAVHELGTSWLVPLGDKSLPSSGTGTSGMEAATANFVEPGTKFALLTNGFFGDPQDHKPGPNVAWAGVRVCPRLLAYGSSPGWYLSGVG